MEAASSARRTQRATNTIRANKMAAPHNKHEPTDISRAKVTALASVGVGHKHIAAYLDISEGTLHNYYKRELTTKLVENIEKIAGRAFQLAMDGDKTMLIFLLKVWARWNSPKDYEEVKRDLEENEIATVEVETVYAEKKAVNE